jgi:choice-of-anchor B domain-containing protein
MKAFLFTAFVVLFMGATYAQNYNITFRSKLSFPGQTLANVWGFAKNGKEYALVGAKNGMTIVDVTNPGSPVVIEQLTDTISSLWREIKTFGNYAYVTSEGTTPNGYGGAGVANLSNLPNTPVPFHKYHGDGLIDNQLKKAHALHVDTVKGFAYIYGMTGLAGGGAIALDLNPDPYNPGYAGQYNASYIHDGYAHNDTVYGSHIYAGYFSIIDFTNKSSPQLIATQATPKSFTHNTWLSQDGNYLFATDEKDNAWLTAYNIDDPTNIIETDRIRTTPGSGSIVHNTHIKEHYAVTSWYKDGVTITDVDRPGNLIQVGWYDTWPGSGSGYYGAWGVYPYLPSGNLLVTNIDENTGSGPDTGALYILTPTYVAACFLEGMVSDFDTHAPLNGVTVAIQHTDPLNYTSSNLGGDYATGQPTSGIYDVVFSKAGYVTQTQQATLSNGNVTTLSVQLMPVSLPIELVSFSAKADGKKNVLEWATSFEKNTLYHEVECKHPKEQEWESIGKVDAAGESGILVYYTFVDHNPAWVTYYRIHTVDFDGEEQYSNTVIVERPLAPFRLESIYPVPSSGILRMDVVTNRASTGNIEVGDYNGKILLKAPISLKEGYNSPEIHLPETWPEGRYWLALSSGNKKETGTFVLQR